MPSKYFDKALANSSEDSKAFVSKTLDIVEQIMDLLEKNGVSQKDLSKTLNKSESEISKWLTGTHNFTVKTLAKLEVALASEIVVTPKRFSEDLRKKQYVRLKSVSQPNKSTVYSSMSNVLKCSDLEVVHKKEWKPTTTIHISGNVNDKEAIA